MEKQIAHDDYIKANLLVESLIDIVDETEKDNELLAKFIEASDVVEAYEEQNYPIGIDSDIILNG